MKVIIMVLLVQLSLQLDTPVWANKFQSTFSEDATYPLIGTSTTTGTFYYNFDLKKYRVDRVNGKWDRYCGSAYKLTDTGCNQYVSEGKRYLDYPEKDYCCYCCDAAHGCGVLKPDWMAGGTYKGVM